MGPGPAFRREQLHVLPPGSADGDGPFSDMIFRMVTDGEYRWVLGNSNDNIYPTEIDEYLLYDMMIKKGQKGE